MTDLRRQPSKVWWSNFPDDEDSRITVFLGWGNGIDLSGNFSEESNCKKKYNAEITPLNTSQLSKSDINAKNPVDEDTRNQEALHWEEPRINTSNWETADLTGNRGNSSSPSQGSHKSQDSGFSDSEIHHNQLSTSPQDSPDLSKRLECTKCSNSNISPKQENEKPDSSEPIVNYDTSKTSIQKLSYHVVEFKEDCNSPKFLETAIDSEEDIRAQFSTKAITEESEVNKINFTSSPKQSRRRNLIKTHISRTKNDNEKINKIQNQLELSVNKLPKKSNLTQNLKASNLIITQFQARPQNCVSGEDQSKRTFSENEEQTSGSVKSFTSDFTVIERPKTDDVKVDNEGFKIPKKLNEQNITCKGSNNFLDLTEIEGPPISSSTPKSTKFQRQESPTLKTARATEKTGASASTFATIRKLKGISEKKIKGPMNLLASFNRCSFRSSKKSKISLDTESSIKQWMSELSTLYEAEIMTTLQSKSLASDLTRQVTNMAATTSETVRKLHQRTKTISSEFSKLCQHMKCKKYKQVKPLVVSLIGHIKEFITDYVEKRDIIPQKKDISHQKACQISQINKDEIITDFRQMEPETKEIVSTDEKIKTKEEEVLEACEKLETLTSEQFLDQETAEELVSQLGRKFAEVVDVLLISHITALISVLEEPRTELALRTALSALTTLGLEGTHLSYLVARCGAVRALLAICLEARATAVRVSALRVLATICCIAETIRQFEQAGGLEIVADILSDETRSEAELSETAAVLAQITAPWVQDNHSVDGLGRFLNILVSSLTRIIKEYKSSETLLLSTAALANLTFMEPRTVWPLLENQTAGILLASVRRQGPKVSVFIQEQAATVIANMASVQECRKHLAEHRAVVALLCFLQIRHSPLQRAAEITAAERVQQKSAIAISRLCSDALVARQVIELHGVTRLVRLCKEERERNHSDGVLVACLAALRKIVANCGTEALEELNAMELVEPRLLDSFLLFSSRQESYV